MPDGQTLEGGDESGGALRQKLEQYVEANKGLRDGMIGMVTKQFDGVTAADLEGIAPGQLEAKAAEISAQRETERQQVVTEALKKVGMSDEQIASVVAGETPGATPPSTQVTEVLGQLGGQPVSREPDMSSLSPAEKIAAGVAADRK